VFFGIPALIALMNILPERLLVQLLSGVIRLHATSLCLRCSPCIRMMWFAL